MLSRSRLVLVGGLTLLAGLIIFFPARLAYEWFAPPELKLGGIEGSVWRGSALEASAAGVYLRDLGWRAQPLSLLAGRLGYRIEASPISGFIQGDLAISLLGKVTARELTGAVSLQALRQVVNNPRLDGSLNLQLLELQAANGVPLSADGFFEISNLVNPGGILTPWAVIERRLRPRMPVSLSPLLRPMGSLTLMVVCRSRPTVRSFSPRCCLPTPRLRRTYGRQSIICRLRTTVCGASTVSKAKSSGP